jgi:Mg2+ and Co2+ transporter CorA
MLPLPALLEAETRVRANLCRLTNLDSPSMQTSLTHQISQLVGLTSSTTTLQSRSQGVISLLSATIDIHNQEQSGELNSHLFDLTQDTVDDSASVRVITFLSLLYLPASFVGTLFGMNLFVFDPDTRRIIIAQDFWIYVLCFVPLTLATVVSAWVWKMVDDKRRVAGRKRKGTAMLAVRSRRKK